MKKKPNRVSFGSIWIRIWVHLEKPGQNREWSSQGWRGSIGFQMHPSVPLWVHLVFPNAPKCRFSQIHPNAWCSKCIQMNNRSVENERSVENRSVGIWYLFRHPHQHHSIIACITWNHNQSSWFLIWWRLGSEKDTFQQGFNMSTDLFSTDLWGLLRQWCWLNTIGPNGERPIVPMMLNRSKPQSAYMFYYFSLLLW